MKIPIVRLFTGVITFMIGVSAGTYSQHFQHPKMALLVRQPAQAPIKPKPKTRDEEILDVLLPNKYWADVSQLDRFDRVEEIHALRMAQVYAEGSRANGIEVLLAALKDNYSVNRGTLLEQLNQCDSELRPEKEECTCEITEYLMELSRRGDSTLYKPIIRVSGRADGGFSEELGVFFSDILLEKSDQFIKSLSSFPNKLQRDVCWLAGSEDGSGMDQEKFQNVRDNLGAIAAASDHKVQLTARKCESAVQLGYLQAIENEEPKVAR